MSDGFTALLFSGRNGHGLFLGRVSGDIPILALPGDRVPRSVATDFPNGRIGTLELYPQRNYDGEPVIISGASGTYDLPGTPIRSIRLRSLY
jgi:hypothetical protein